MAPRERKGITRQSSDERDVEAPILRATRHLVRPNGSIVGREVAEVISPIYQSFVSAIPTRLANSANQPALASIDGRAAITHERIYNFIVNEFGPTLDQLGFGRGHRVALVLPNGP